MFPRDNYTPFGYLDNPFHTWKLNRSGVIRVNPPCGFGWLFPNAHNPIYRAAFKIGIQFENQRLIFAEDFKNKEIPLICSYHSKNLFRFNWRWQNIDFSADFFLTDEHVLAANIELNCSKEISTNLSLIFLQSIFLDYRRTGLWDFGLTGRYNEEANALVIKSFAEGYCFILKSSMNCQGHCFSDDLSRLQNQEFELSKPGRDFFSTINSSLFGLIQIPVEITEQNSFQLSCVFSRSVSENKTIALADRNLPELAAIRDDRIKEDEQFWQSCPRLEGDWPDHWKRGWIYDWETMRMNLREPIGIFSTHWDAMQIQKPRIVLAETALDMLMMSYAQPEISQEVILGLFQDALNLQVPCAREDGSLNMISEDGSECGTSPAWCFPFYCFQSIVMRHFDRDWLERLFAYLEKYLEWWLKNRTDEGGWAVYNCSWESGQDASSKFLVEQVTGGEIVSHLRAVDLQSAMAQSANILSFFALCLNRKDDRWDKIYRRFVEKILAMWQEDWFCDFDKRINSWIQKDDWRDVTNLAPFFVGIYNENQLRIAEKWFEYFVQNPKLWLEWASFFFMYIEACWQVGFKQLASKVLFNTIDRVYKNWDSREWQEGEPMPGISVECWGLEKPYGSEGYGWAATLPLHIIRSLIGFREYQPDFQNSFLLCPNFPDELLIPGNTYAISSLKFQDKVFSINYKIINDQLIKVHSFFKSIKKFNMAVLMEKDNLIYQAKEIAAEHQFKIHLKNRDKILIRFLN